MTSPQGGGGVRVCAHSPLESIFFLLYGGSFCYFFSMWGPFSYDFLFMHITIRVRFTDYVVPPPPPGKRTKKAPTWNKNSKKVPHIKRGEGEWVLVRGGGRVRRDLITHFKLLLLNLLLRSYAYGYIEMCLPRGEEAPSKSQNHKKKRINACALVTKRLLRLLSPQEKPMRRTTFTPFVPQKNRMKRTTFTTFVLIHQGACITNAKPQNLKFI